MYAVALPYVDRLSLPVFQEGITTRDQQSPNLRHWKKKSIKSLALRGFRQTELTSQQAVETSGRVCGIIILAVIETPLEGGGRIRSPGMRTEVV